MQRQVLQKLVKNVFKTAPVFQPKGLSKSVKMTFAYERHELKFNEKGEEYVFKPTPTNSTPTQKTFRVIDLQGKVVAKEFDNIDGELLNKIYEKMLVVEEIDDILNKTQRQGKISFYMPSFGELATTIGTAAALKDQDLIFSQYREQGALLWRGFTIDQVLNQCIGNVEDLGKGRQMPVHYGSQELNWVTVSSPLTTQVPQASGAGYKYRLNNEDKVAVAFFGEGAASEGDFHSALNFAATLECQTLFLCRNNKWAISTPAADQYRGDHIAGKAIGYGVQTYRVDGNDVLACIHTIKLAREYIIKNKKPAFVEFMTYRIGDHSTSDHSVLYRTESEIESWKTINNPITRLGLYLQQSGKRKLDEKKDKQLRDETRKSVIAALGNATKKKMHHWDTMFEDVYDKMTPNLVEQQKQLNEHIEKYGEHYNLDKFQQ